MSYVLLLEIDLRYRDHRSIGLLTIDLQYNAPSEIIPTWNLRNLMICMTIVLKFQQTTIHRLNRGKETSAVVSLRLFSWAPPNAMRMCYALHEKLIIGRGCLHLLCLFPSGCWIRANIQCGHCKVVCLFKQETSEGAMIV